MPASVERHVLIVDDDAFVASTLADYLGKHGYHPFTARSTADGVRKLRARTYYAVISDLRLPGEDGKAILAAVKQLMPDACRILVTGDHTARRDRLVGEVCDALLHKPFGPEQLTAMLDAWAR